MRNQLRSIRPILKGITVEKETTVMESFQNRTLRPILKLQNSLLVAIFTSHLEKNKITLNQLSDSKKNEHIEQTLKKDRKIHDLLLGVIIGHFIDTEYQEYKIHEKEFNRRITTMLIQRLQSQL